MCLIYVQVHRYIVCTITIKMIFQYPGFLFYLLQYTDTKSMRQNYLNKSTEWETIHYPNFQFPNDIFNENGKNENNAMRTIPVNSIMKLDD